LVTKNVLFDIYIVGGNE